MKSSQFVNIHAAADYLAPGSIEINRYQTEILDRVRRRYPFGQRIDQTPATGHPSRYFEQISIPTGGFVDPRQLSATGSQPTRIEQTVPLKAMMGQINFGLFDVEVTQQQAQYSYLEAKDLTDAVDGLLKVHDQALWNGNDTSLTLPTSTAYYGVSGQLFNAVANGAVNVQNVPSSGSLVDAIKLQVALLGANQTFEVKPSAFYSNPLLLNLFDKEAKQFQLYFNNVQILPGVIVNAIPTQMGNIPLIPDPAITVFAPQGGNVGDVNSTYTGFLVSEDLIQYHWLTNPMPRVFQLGLVGNLASQYTILKFGAVVVKGAGYAHARIITTR